MLTYVDLIAIYAKAMSGALAAGRRNKGLFGVTVRDILCNRTPQVLQELSASVLQRRLAVAPLDDPFRLVAADVSLCGGAVGRWGH